MGGNEAAFVIPPPPSPAHSTPRQPRSQRQRARKSLGLSVLDKVKLGSFLGVVSTECTRAECTVLSKKTGTYYQKCHCVVKEVKDLSIRIAYMNAECGEEWLSIDDSRIVLNK